jgi:hypothetical protein
MRWRINKGSPLSPIQMSLGPIHFLRLIPSRPDQRDFRAGLTYSVCFNLALGNGWRRLSLRAAL